MIEKYKSIFSKRIIVYITVISIILTSGHAFYTLIPAVKYIKIPMVLLYMAPVITYIINNRKCLIKDYMILSLSIFFFMVLINILFYFKTGLTPYFHFMTVLSFSFGVVVIYDYNSFKRCFLKIMFMLCLISLVGYFASNYTAVLEKLPTITNRFNYNYKIGILFNYIVEVPQRNFGMFWEPGIFASYILCAIIFELYNSENKWKAVRIVIFIVTLLTTKSAAGYVILILVLILILIKRLQITHIRISRNNVLVFLLLLTIILIVPIIIQNTKLINSHSLGRLTYQNILTSSRLNAVKHNLLLFMKKPFIGHGLVYAGRVNAGDVGTSTTTYLMSVYGVLGTIYTYFWGFGIFLNNKLSNLEKYVLLFIIILILNKEPHFNFVFTWCLLFYQLKPVN